MLNACRKNCLHFGNCFHIWLKWFHRSRIAGRQANRTMNLTASRFATRECAQWHVPRPSSVFQHSRMDFRPSRAWSAGIRPRIWSRSPNADETQAKTTTKEFRGSRASEDKKKAGRSVFIIQIVCVFEIVMGSGWSFSLTKANASVLSAHGQLVSWLCSLVKFRIRHAKALLEPETLWLASQQVQIHKSEGQTCNIRISTWILIAEVKNWKIPCSASEIERAFWGNCQIAYKLANTTNCERRMSSCSRDQNFACKKWQMSKWAICNGNLKAVNKVNTYIG